MKFKVTTVTDCIQWYEVEAQTKEEAKQIVLGEVEGEFRFLDGELAFDTEKALEAEEFSG